MAQLSRLSLEVPVFTATVFPGITSFELGPNASTRALLSESISERIKAVWGFNACFCLFGLISLTIMKVLNTII